MIVASDDIDFKDNSNSMWMFEMSEWNDGKIPRKKTKSGKWYEFFRKDMDARIAKTFGA